MPCMSVQHSHGNDWDWIVNWRAAADRQEEKGVMTSTILSIRHRPFCLPGRTALNTPLWWHVPDRRLMGGFFFVWKRQEQHVGFPEDSLSKGHRKNKKISYVPPLCDLEICVRVWECASSTVGYALLSRNDFTIAICILCSCLSLKKISLMVKHTSTGGLNNIQYTSMSMSIIFPWLLNIVYLQEVYTTHKSSVCLHTHRTHPSASTECIT